MIGNLINKQKHPALIGLFPIEVVITALTRNQVCMQMYRGFESLPLRQKGTSARKQNFESIPLRNLDILNLAINRCLKFDEISSMMFDVRGVIF